MSWFVCGSAIAAFLFRLGVLAIRGADLANGETDLSIYLAAAARLRAGLSIYQTQVDVP